MVHFWRVSATAALAIAVAGGASLGPAAPAFAAPGDASARGVVIDLNASVGVVPVPVINADATIGEVSAPTPSGTNTENVASFSLPPGPPVLGVTAAGTLVRVSATRGADASSASASVATFELTVLEDEVLSVTGASAEVNCPRVGDQTADTDLAGVELFGDPVPLLELEPNEEFTITAPITALPLTDATLTVVLTRVETTSATGATAIALLATFTLNGEIEDVAIEPIAVGSVTLAEAICERPAAAPPTTPPATPRPILPVTGNSSDSTGILLAVGTAMILAGVVARVTFRRRSERTSTIS